MTQSETLGVLLEALGYLAPLLPVVLVWALVVETIAFLVAGIIRAVKS